MGEDWVVKSAPNRRSTLSVSLASLAQAAHAAPLSTAFGQQVAAIATDSRTLPADALFVALRGEHFDGHDFLEASVAAGACAVMVDALGASRAPSLAVPMLVVPDTLRALGDMAHFVRQGRGKVAAVTGSNGKTTTKELLAAALSERGPVHKTHGNLNNLIGLPLTVFAWPTDAWAAVLEMGMSAPGEIDRLSAIAQPDVALVTHLGPAHLGGPGLGSMEAIAAAKAEIFNGLGPLGVAVLAADEPLLLTAASQTVGTRRQVRFGSRADTDVQVLRCRAVDSSIEVTLRIDTTEVTFVLPLVGEHNAHNAAAAAAAAWVLGLTPEAIAHAMPRVAPPPGRLQLKRHGTRPLWVLDDTYNANPSSARAAVQALRSAAKGMRPVAVLGDMLELGPTAEALHYDVGRAAAELGVATLYTLGDLGQAIARGAQSAGLQATAFVDFDSLCHTLLRDVRDGDCVLVKGSRGMRMERIVQALLGADGHRGKSS